MDWECGSLQSCSPIQDRKILLRRPRNSLCSAIPESEPSFDSRFWDSSLDAETIHQFLLVLLDLFLRNRFFSILQFLDNLLLDFFSEESVPHFQSSIQDYFFCLFEPDQPIDSLVVAVIVGTRTLD